MKDRGIERFLLLLAASPLTEQEIREVGVWIGRSGPGEFTRAVRSIRQLAEDEARHLPRHALEADLMVAEVGGDVGDLASKIDHLLRVEARLSGAEAAQMLSRQLPEIGPWKEKESFRRWLERVSKHVPAATLLHVASRIRNDLVHGRRDAWPLKEGGPDDKARR